MTAEQLSNLWAFARGDIAAISFEKWFLVQDDLEAHLGEDLHWRLASANYRDRDLVWKLRKSLAGHLSAHERCKCASIRDLAAVPMGGDGLDERVFATIEKIRTYGDDLWWLHLSKCSECGQHWMIAQEERIFDDYFLRRLPVDVANRISLNAEWPVEFLSYERVLKTGHALGIRPCVFLERLSPSPVWTAEELRKERPDISVEEIALLLYVTAPEAKQLLAAASSGQTSWWQRTRSRLGW